MCLWFWFSDCIMRSMEPTMQTLFRSKESLSIWVLGKSRLKKLCVPTTKRQPAILLKKAGLSPKTRRGEACELNRQVFIFPQRRMTSIKSLNHIPNRKEASQCGEDTHAQEGTMKRGLYVHTRMCIRQTNYKGPPQIVQVPMVRKSIWTSLSAN